MDAWFPTFLSTPWNPACKCVTQNAHNHSVTSTGMHNSFGARNTHSSLHRSTPQTPFPLIPTSPLSTLRSEVSLKRYNSSLTYSRTQTGYSIQTLTDSLGSPDFFPSYLFLIICVIRPQVALQVYLIHRDRDFASLQLRHVSASCSAQRSLLSQPDRW